MYISLLLVFSDLVHVAIELIPDWLPNPYHFWVDEISYKRGIDTMKGILSGSNPMYLISKYQILVVAPLAMIVGWYFYCEITSGSKDTSFMDNLFENQLWIRLRE